MSALRIELAPSPSRGPRRGGARPDLIVLHYTGMTSAEEALARLRDPEAQVSAHYLIAEDGRVWSMVPEAERAWHAGAGRWGEVEDVNSRSLGVELANPGPLAGFPPFAEAQIAVLETLLREVMERWLIPPHGVIAHSDMAPGRKVDPGPAFPWRRLAEAGVATWPRAVREATADRGRFLSAAERIGYRVPADGGWRAVLDAFRLRFRPAAQGPLEGADVAWAEAVAAVASIDAAVSRA